MGGSGSTRRVTVQEDDGPGMVKISENVVKRLVGQDEASVSKQAEYQPGDRMGLSRREEDDLHKIEQYYQEKIHVLEDRNNQLFEEQKHQFAEAVQEVEKKFLKTTASPICQDLQTAVLECYQNNPNQTLLCSAHVKAFNECVQQQRERILTKKG